MHFRKSCLVSYSFLQMHAQFYILSNSPKMVGIEMGIECILKVIYLAYLIRNAQTQPLVLVSTSFINQKQLTRYAYVILDIQTPQYKISIPLKGNKIKCTVVLIKFCFIYLRNRKKVLQSKVRNRDVLLPAFIFVLHIDQYKNEKSFFATQTMPLPSIPRKLDIATKIIV